MSAAISPLAVLLAQAGAATDAATQSQAFWFIGGLVAVCVMANQVMGAIVTFRKLKGADPTADHRYASKAALGEVKIDLEGLRGEVRGISTTLQNELRAIHRALGRIEGRLGTEPPDRSSGTI